ncbi:MAG TPA: hypothetical protein PLV45_12060, partial [bacterium]|nr:hypothetical protein [bacterium]
SDTINTGIYIIEPEVLDRFQVDTVELGRGFLTDPADWKPWRLPDGTPCKIPVYQDLEEKDGDRYLLDRIADRIWSIEDQRIEDYPGNYSDYKHMKALAVQPETSRTSDRETDGKDLKNRKEQRKARAELRKKTGKSAAFYEKEVERLEAELAMIREEMKNPGIATNWNALDELSSSAERIRAELDQTIELWEQAAEAESELGI